MRRKHGNGSVVTARSVGGLERAWLKWGRETTGWACIFAIVCVGAWFGSEAMANYIGSLMYEATFGR